MPQPQISNEAWDEHLIRYGMDFAPVLIARALGSVIWDTNGRAMLDFTSGQMCATIGHNHPRIVAAIQEACEGALHLYSGMLSPAVVALSQRLTAMLPEHLSKALFLSTGGESTEAALKLAKLHTGRYEIVGLSGSWHGMTSGAQAVNYAAGRKGYGPMMPGALSIPAPCAYHCPIRHCRDVCDTTCLDVGFEMVDGVSAGSLAALIAEPVESSGGVIVPPEGYWDKAKAHCDARGMLLIFDEAQTAFGRLGRDSRSSISASSRTSSRCRKRWAAGCRYRRRWCPTRSRRTATPRGSSTRPRTSPTRCRRMWRWRSWMCWRRKG